MAALIKCEGLETLSQSLERFDETVPEEAQARHHALGVFEHIIEDEDVAKRSARVLQTWLSTRIVAKKGDDAVKLYSAEVLSILCGSCATILATPETIDSLLRACAKYRRKDPESPDDEELLENLFQSLAALLSGASSTAVPEFVKAEGVELMLRCLSEGRAAAAPSLRVLAAALEHPRDDAMEEATGAPRRVISADGMRHLFPALMGRGAARGAVVGAADRRAKKRRKRRRNDDQRALDEHVVACVAALCLYAANDGAPDEARARLVRKFLEKDQEKLKKVLERYGGYMRDVVAIEREGGADPLQTLARALGAGLHALRLCGAILAFCAVFAPAARPTLLEGLGRGGVGELANCVSDPRGRRPRRRFRGGRRRGGGARGDAAGMGGGRRGGRTFVNPSAAARQEARVRSRPGVEGGDEASSRGRRGRRRRGFGRGRAPASRAATTPSASANRRKRCSERRSASRDACSDAEPDTVDHGGRSRPRRRRHRMPPQSQRKPPRTQNAKSCATKGAMRARTKLNDASTLRRDVAVDHGRVRGARSPRWPSRRSYFLSLRISRRQVKYRVWRFPAVVVCAKRRARSSAL